MSLLEADIQQAIDELSQSGAAGVDVLTAALSDSVHMANALHASLNDPKLRRKLDSEAKRQRKQAHLTCGSDNSLMARRATCCDRAPAQRRCTRLTRPAAHHPRTPHRRQRREGATAV